MLGPQSVQTRTRHAPKHLATTMAILVNVKSPVAKSVPVTEHRSGNCVLAYKVVTVASFKVKSGSDCN